MAIHDVMVLPAFLFSFQISHVELRFYISRLSFTKRSWEYGLKSSIV